MVEIMVEIGGGALSGMLNKEELKIAEGLLCPLSTTLKSLMSPWMKTADRFQKQNTQKWGISPPSSGRSAQSGDGRGLVWASCNNMTPRISPTL